MHFDLLPVELFLWSEDSLAVEQLARREPLFSHEKNVNQTIKIDHCDADWLNNKKSVRIAWLNPEEYDGPQDETE